MIKIFSDNEALNLFAAEKIVEIYNEAIKKTDSFVVALSGGSTPKSLYGLLSRKFKDKIDWSKVFFFFSDERNVLPEDKKSNFRMAKENLFEPLKIPVEQILQWDTGLENPEKIAGEYETDAIVFFALSEDEFPRFDLILLGMGDDGHTASLFPFTDALKETKKIAVENWVEKLKDWRFTLTFPTINNAENIIFLITGEAKAETLREVLEGEFQPLKYPSQSVKPDAGNLFWLIDEPAARLLTSANS